MSSVVISVVLDALLFGALLSVGLTCLNLYRNEFVSSSPATACEVKRK